MSCFHYVLILAVPDHWCYVPGINNYTLKEWKAIHIPWDYSKNSYDKCLMYDENNLTTTCQNGYEYDKTWYLETVSSKENWVCANSMKVTHAFEFSKVGEILGTLSLGYVGDRYGRKPAFYSAVATLFIGGMLTLITTSRYPLFILSLLLISFSSNAVYQVSLIIGFEISKDEKRSMISCLQCVAYTTGFCLLAFVYSYFRYWMPLVLFSTAPLLLFFVFRGYMIESPRWLLNQGKVKRSLEELQKIAKTNKTRIPDVLVAKIQNIEKREESDMSRFTDLFKNITIARITLLTIISWPCWNLIYVILYLNVTNLKGNPYSNFFWQSLAELPGYIIGKYLSDYLGRKLSRIFAFFISSIGCLMLVFLIADQQYQLLVSIISMVLKLSISIVYYVISLQTMEVFPTSVRQRGAGFGFLAGSILSISAPSLIHLGVVQNPKIPYIAASFFGFLGTMVGFFIPETLNEKLPESVKELEDIVKRQRMFPILKHISTI
ncbi:unnamed protein product [Brassicogethes aeneus]|uniref:Major facilitator superfamily (MFS) profile domain-containing protein n=1 Tax=Brassicogethes aeneus TaxID=1431903 RepID=A0A9P0B254_BRAAE|nr:unnamed protein product [Brassicogethes aeneus]